jgi:hypothetical protein
MKTVQVELPVDLVRAANLDEEHLSAETARSLALLFSAQVGLGISRLKAGKLPTQVIVTTGFRRLAPAPFVRYRE